MHPNEIAINDYVDGTLDPAERTEVERHLQACAECRALVDDFSEIRRTAASLDPREPPVRGWARIDRVLRLTQDEPIASRPAIQLATPQRSPQTRLRSSYLAWIAAAAILVLAAGATLRNVSFFGPGTPGAGSSSTTSTGATGAANTAGGGDAAQAVEAELRQAEQHYEKAIKGLEQIAAAEQSALDPQTAATLQKNLAVIDMAINESRAALREQPASEPAQQSLLDNFKSKIDVLQDTVALINEMRKGNEAGAARIVSGLKQKGT
jgi:anti-sigma factor RsiW